MLDKENEKDKAWMLASRIGNCLFLVLFFLCAIGFIFAEQVVKYILVPGFSLHDPELQVLTVKLLRIQLPSVLIFGISGLIMGILNTNGNFLFPGLAPAMYQVGIMIGVTVFAKPFGITGVAMGAVLGSLLHFLIQFPHLLRIKGARYYPSLGLKDPNVREIVRLMIPRQIGASAVQLNFLVDNYLASFLSVNELVGNYELMHPKSTFLYKEDLFGDSKYIFGPVWDMDWAFGYETNHNYYTTGATDDFYSNPRHTFSGGSDAREADNFWKHLRYSDEAVDRAYYKLWTRFMTQNGIEELIDFCDEYYNYANSSFQNNAYIWGDGYNYSSNKESAKKWLRQRRNGFASVQSISSAS